MRCRMNNISHKIAKQFRDIVQEFATIDELLEVFNSWICQVDWEQKTFGYRNNVLRMLFFNISARYIMPKPFKYPIAYQMKRFCAWLK